MIPTAHIHSLSTTYLLFFRPKISSIFPPVRKNTTMPTISVQNVNLNRLKFVPSLSGSKKSEMKDLPPNKKPNKVSTAIPTNPIPKRMIIKIEHPLAVSLADI